MDDSKEASPMADELLLDWFKDIGCPYEPGSVDSVVWLGGYRAGIGRAKAEVDAMVREATPSVRGRPVTISWPNAHSRRPS
jgi:hypothetical protein